MSDYQTLARPYAKAIFELAVAQQTLATWSNLLSVLAFIGEDNRVRDLCRNPHVSIKDLADIFIALAGNLSNDAEKNFIYLLAQNHRLLLLPTIAVLFEEYKSAFEKTIPVKITSAFPINEKLKQEFKIALEKRLEQQINLEITVDQSLLGGAIIRAGDDLVIDGSVRTKLSKMCYTLISGSR